MAREVLREGEKEEYWKEHEEKCNRSGMSQAEYCRRQKLSPKLFTYWKRKLREQEAISFIPVQIKPERYIPAEQTTGVVLYKEEYRIEIKEGFRREVL